MTPRTSETAPSGPRHRPAPPPRPDTVALPYNLVWFDSQNRLASLFAGVSAKVAEKKTDGPNEIWTVNELIAPNLRTSFFTFQQGMLIGLEFDYGQDAWDTAKYNAVMGDFRRLLETKCESPGEIISRKSDQVPNSTVKETLMGYQWVRGDTIVQLFYYAAEDTAKALNFRSISVHYHYRDPYGPLPGCRGDARARRAAAAGRANGVGHRDAVRAGQFAGRRAALAGQHARCRNARADAHSVGWSGPRHNPRRAGPGRDLRHAGRAVARSRTGRDGRRERCGGGHGSPAVPDPGRESDRHPGRHADAERLSESNTQEVVRPEKEALDAHPHRGRGASARSMALRGPGSLYASGGGDCPSSSTDSGRGCAMRHATNAPMTRPASRTAPPAVKSDSTRLASRSCRPTILSATPATSRVSPGAQGNSTKIQPGVLVMARLYTLTNGCATVPGPDDPTRLPAAIPVAQCLTTA